MDVNEFLLCENGKSFPQTELEVFSSEILDLALSIILPICKMKVLIRAIFWQILLCFTIFQDVIIIQELEFVIK